jgi:hypothetical protein
MTVIHACPACDWTYSAKGHMDKTADRKFEQHWSENHKRKVKREANTRTAKAARR